MLNVKQTIKGNKLVIEVDLTKEFGLSKSGKTTIIASTQGNVPVGFEDVRIGLNIYKGVQK